jgi:3-phosphoshikimate 1-carboxyvinyltransferase
MGVRVEELVDGALIHGAPGAVHGAMVRGFHDHRIHMALSVLALVAKGRSRVSDRECVEVSYPEFHADLERIVQAESEEEA